jgi:hypothetical protein
VLPDERVRRAWILGLGALGLACGTAAPSAFRPVEVIPAGNESVCLEDAAAGPELTFRVPPCVCPAESRCEVLPTPDGALDVHPRLHDPGCDACVEGIVRCPLPPPSSDGRVPVRLDGRPAFVLEAAHGAWGPADGCWEAPPGFGAVRVGPIEEPDGAGESGE